MTAQHDNMEQRLTDLEIKACFSEDTVELLNQVVIRQQHQIDGLVREIASLQASLSTAEGGGARLLRDELPPHY